MTGEKSPPAALVEELKAYLRLEDSREDVLLAGFLRAATEAVEAALGQLLLVREVEELGIARDGSMVLGMEPVRLLISAFVADAGGEFQALGEYARLSPMPHGRGRILLDTVADGRTVQVLYRAGIAGNWNQIPEVLRLAVIRVAAHFHAHRDAVEAVGIPPAVSRLLAPWRARRLR